MRPTSMHLGFLDGIRGGAALWVLVTHCMIWGGCYSMRVPSPKIAVDIFMIVSGFLMAFQYARRESVEPPSSARTAIRFWLRRFFRIAPVYYLLLLVLFVFWNQYSQGLLTLQAATPERWPQPSVYDPSKYQMTPLNLLLHATFLFALIPKYVLSFVSPDWSIGLEMQFYAMFPLLFLVLRRVHWVGLLIVGVGTSMYCSRAFAPLPGIFPGLKGLYPEPSVLVLKLPLFLIGMLGAELFNNAKQKFAERLLLTAALVLLAAHYSIWTGVAAALVCGFGWRTLADQYSFKKPCPESCLSWIES